MNTKTVPNAYSNQPTHVAYTDETQYNVGRFRGIALITLRREDKDRLSSELNRLLKESEVSEFKWEKLASARERFAALKILDYAVKNSINGELRVDILTWDIEDSRHKVKKRDDIANLQRMYYHLFRNVLCERWPDKCSWNLCPDEHTALRWDQIEDFLDIASVKIEVHEDLFTFKKFSVWLKKEFSIQQITPCRSYEEPLIQTADLFAGLAVYSRNSYDRFKQWQAINNQQQTLFQVKPGSSVQFSKSDRERCHVLSRFDILCKKRKLGVSLRTCGGLKTFQPQKPINFWWYVPQHEADEAPVKNSL